MKIKFWGIVLHKVRVQNALKICIQLQWRFFTAQFIIQNGEKYSQMQVVNGFKQIPPVQEYFIDGVHPNELGMELYAQNLLKEIDKIGF